MNSTNNFPLAGGMVAHGGTDLGRLVSANFEIRVLERLEFDPCLGDVVANYIVIRDRNFSTSREILCIFVSLFLPSASFMIANS